MDYEHPFALMLDKDQHKHFAKLVGSYMMTVIMDRSVSQINRNSISTNCGFKTAVDRWGAAVRYLSRPRQGIPGQEDLTQKELGNLDKSSEKLISIRDLSRNLKKDRVLREPFRCFNDFPKTNEDHIDTLLKNGVIDTAQWLTVLTYSGVNQPDMGTHPLFLVATTFTDPGHRVLSTTLQNQCEFVGGATIPFTRVEAARVVQDAEQEVREEALKSVEGRNPQALIAPGFCPAGRMTDDNGVTWVHSLAQQGAELITAMPPPFSP